MILGKNKLMDLVLLAPPPQKKKKKKKTKQPNLVKSLCLSQRLRVLQRILNCSSY